MIGDIPWVAQCVESYVSKIFSCAYSSATITVFSGNPVDHLAHRMSHRLVRGSLFACGRPDGRLAALSASEGAVCHCVNYIASVMMSGSRSEIITIGHNPHKLKMTMSDIFLRDCRKRYICEFLHQKLNGNQANGEDSDKLCQTFAYLRKKSRNQGNNTIASDSVNSNLSLRKNAGASHRKQDYHSIGGDIRDNHLVLSKEKYYGENMEMSLKGISPIRIVEDQTLSMRLYETRFASLQRAVAFFVLFYHMGKDVQVCCALILFQFISFLMASTIFRIGGQSYLSGFFDMI